jgi:hypothetical protein
MRKPSACVLLPSTCRQSLPGMRLRATWPSGYEMLAQQRSNGPRAQLFVGDPTQQCTLGRLFPSSAGLLPGTPCVECLAGQRALVNPLRHSGSSLYIRAVTGPHHAPSTQDSGFEAFSLYPASVAAPRYRFRQWLHQRLGMVVPLVLYHTSPGARF